MKGNSMKNARFLASATAVLAVAALALTGCSGSNVSLSSGTGGQASDGLTTIRVSGVPSENMSALNLGQSMGYFKDQGLRVEVVPAQGGAAIINGVVQGSQEFGYATLPPLAIARSQGQAIVGVTGSGYMYPGSNITMVGVKADSGITGFDGLKGKKVGVNQLHSFLDICLSAYFQQKGEDPLAATPVELPFAQLVPSTVKGQINAAVLTEPFSSIGISQGLHNIGDICDASLPKSASVGMFFTSEKFKAENRKAVDGFNAAMTKTIAYLNEHPHDFAVQVAKDAGSNQNADDLNPRKERAEILPEPTKGYLQILANLHLIPAESVDSIFKALVP